MISSHVIMCSGLISLSLLRAARVAAVTAERSKLGGQTRVEQLRYVESMGKRAGGSATTVDMSAGEAGEAAEAAGRSDIDSESKFTDKQY